MIVVVGSRHDPVAVALVDAWPGAALCSAEDFTVPGWTWRLGHPGSARWVVNGNIVPDSEVTGVFVRRSLFLAEEFTSTHPADRAYLSAEVHAFLVFVLASTSALVVNSVRDGAFGEEALRPDLWAGAARHVGLNLAPARMSSRPRPHRLRPVAVELVGDTIIGEASRRCREALPSLAHMLGLIWATFVFDGRGRLITVTTARRPTEESISTLGRLLSRASA